MRDEPSASAGLEPSDRQIIVALTRQLHGIKLLLGFFFIMFIIILVILGFITYKVVTFTNDVTAKVDSFQSQASETLDFKKKICDNNSVNSFLNNKSDICK